MTAKAPPIMTGGKLMASVSTKFSGLMWRATLWPRRMQDNETLIIAGDYVELF
jgi:hypothetical protein